MSTSRLHAALSLDSLGPDLRAAFELASTAGYSGVALPTNHPQLADLGETARRHLKKTLHSRNLAIDSIRIAAPLNGLTDSATIDRTLDNAGRAIELAHGLGVGVVSLYAGPVSAVIASEVIPDSVLAACRNLAGLADRAGVTLALSTDSASSLLTLLAAIAAHSLRANFDANLPDPLAAAGRLAAFIAQVTLADSRRSGLHSQPVPLGSGNLPLQQLLVQMQSQHFLGPTVVDLRNLPNPNQAALDAADVLRRVFYNG